MDLETKLAALPNGHLQVLYQCRHNEAALKEEVGYLMRDTKDWQELVRAVEKEVRRRYGA